MNSDIAGSKTAIGGHTWGWIALSGVPVMYLFLLLVIDMLISLFFAVNHDIKCVGAG